MKIFYLTFHLSLHHLTMKYQTYVSLHIFSNKNTKTKRASYSQVQANHLITASVMAAPCALAMSKLSCPETKKSTAKDEVVMEKP